MLKRAEILVSGQVQGVGFRWWAREQAAELGLTGLARNKDDGTVLIIVEGEEGSILEFAERCRSGPPLARVDNVRITWGEHEGAFAAFYIA
jgi:acylphosphatase